MNYSHTEKSLIFQPPKDCCTSAKEVGGDFISSEAFDCAGVMVAVFSKSIKEADSWQRIKVRAWFILKYLEEICLEKGL